MKSVKCENFGSHFWHILIVSVVEFDFHSFEVFEIVFIMFTRISSTTQYSEAELAQFDL